jgi:pimeloyl-ACP methyl ester carboxylesterase
MILIYKWLMCASIGVSLPNYRLKWTLCGDELQLLCTTLMVPLWDSTLKNSFISLDLVKYEAKVRPPENTIIFHPDGPGIRGVKYLQNAFPYFAELFDNSADVISFNHRGLSNSHLWDAKRANDFAEISLYYAENLAALSEWTFLEHHSRKTAEFIGEVKNCFTTTNIARDLEFIRLSLGMKKMNFWGIGYGSLIGTIYANMFPKSVGHMVLDGAMDPTRYFDNPLQYIYQLT